MPPLMPSGRKHKAIAIGLFVLTAASITLSQLPYSGSGFMAAARVGLSSPSGWMRAGLFAIALLSILVSHELAHYIVGKRLRIPTAPPYFIPAPNLLGTLGAVIVVDDACENRRHLLWMGASGPLAGAVVAIVFCSIGLHLSPAHPHLSPWVHPTYDLGSSVLFSILHGLFGPDAKGALLHPFAFAGWSGLLLTAANLIPAGDLDGGHVAYALLGKRQAIVGKAIAVVLVAGGALTAALLSSPAPLAWSALGLLLLVVGVEHGPTQDDSPIAPKNYYLAGLCALLGILCFSPSPVYWAI